MAEKHLDKIIWQPTIKSMNIMTEQMAKMVATVKKIKWGRKHGFLALVLDKEDYKRASQPVD